MKLGILFIAAVLQVVTSQGPPPQCVGPPKFAVKPHECCKLPKLFKDEDFKECGFKMMEHEGPPRGSPSGPPPHIDCTKHECMMKKYNLLKDDGSIDFDGVNGLMDNMLIEKPEFEDAVALAKTECTSGKTLPGPPQICEPDRLLHCISNIFFENCPNWDPSDDCTSLKNLLEECKPFFMKH